MCYNGQGGVSNVPKHGLVITRITNVFTLPVLVLAVSLHRQGRSRGLISKVDDSVKGQCCIRFSWEVILL